MRAFDRRFVLACGCLAVIALLAAQTAAQQVPEVRYEVSTYAPPAAPIELPPGDVIRDESSAAARVRTAIAKRADYSFEDTPLGDVAAWIEEQFDIDVVIDTEALAADGKGTETPISFVQPDPTLAEALAHLLSGHGLTYLVRHEVLLITTKASASQPENLSVRVYQVHDLVTAPNDAAARHPDFDGLIRLLHAARPMDWSDNGGTIALARPVDMPGVLALAILHTEMGHREIERLLVTLRRAKDPQLAAAQAKRPFTVTQQRTMPTPAPAQKSEQEAAKPGAKTTHAVPQEPAAPESAPQPREVDTNIPPGDAEAVRPPSETVLFEQSDMEKKIRAALERPAALDWKELKLGDAVHELEKQHSIPIQLDLMALAADGKGPETPLTRKVSRTTLRSALRLVLDGQGLAYLIQNGALVVTTKAAAGDRENMMLRIYPVQDLVAWPGRLSAAEVDFDSLIELITCFVQMPFWDCNGSCPFVWMVDQPGTLALAVQSDESGHEQVEQLLKYLRRAQRSDVFKLQLKRFSVKPTSVRIHIGHGGFGGGIGGGMF